MAPEEGPKPKKVSKEEFDVISNRLAVALAKRESLIKSWTASSSRPARATRTQEELDTEDAVLFRNQPAYLGVGAVIPAHFLISDAQQNNKSLRQKLYSGKGLKASKARDAEEKAVSAKRAMRDEDSDEEQGRSALGRAKKLKTKPKAVLEVSKDIKDGTSVADAKIAAFEDKIASEMETSKATKSKKDPKEEKATKPTSKAEDSKPVSEKREERTLNDASKDEDSEGDADMDNRETEGSEQGDSISAQTTSGPKKVIDAKERKRMKKRAQKKKAKLRAAQAAAQQKL